MGKNKKRGTIGQKKEIGLKNSDNTVLDDVRGNIYRAYVALPYHRYGCIYMS